MFYVYLYHFGIIIFVFYPEAVKWSCSSKSFFKNFTKVTRKRLGWSFFLSSTSKFIKIETLAQVLANFCDFLKNIPFNGPPLLAASLHHNMQSIKIHKGSCMQWALCLSVSRANGATCFYLLQRHI